MNIHFKNITVVINNFRYSFVTLIKQYLQFFTYHIFEYYQQMNRDTQVNNFIQIIKRHHKQQQRLSGKKISKLKSPSQSVNTMNKSQIANQNTHLLGKIVNKNNMGSFRKTIVNVDEINHMNEQRQQKKNKLETQKKLLFIKTDQKQVQIENNCSQKPMKYESKIFKDPIRTAKQQNQATKQENSNKVKKETASLQDRINQIFENYKSDRYLSAYEVSSVHQDSFNKHQIKKKIPNTFDNPLNTIEQQIKLKQRNKFEQRNLESIKFQQENRSTNFIELYSGCPLGHEKNSSISSQQLFKDNKKPWFPWINKNSINFDKKLEKYTLISKTSIKTIQSNNSGRQFHKQKLLRKNMSNKVTKIGEQNNIKTNNGVIANINKSFRSNYLASHGKDSTNSIHGYQSKNGSAPIKDKDKGMLINAQEDDWELQEYVKIQEESQRKAQSKAKIENNVYKKQAEDSGWKTKIKNEQKNKDEEIRCKKMKTKQSVIKKTPVSYYYKRKIKNKLQGEQKSSLGRNKSENKQKCSYFDRSENRKNISMENNRKSYHVQIQGKWNNQIENEQEGKEMKIEGWKVKVNFAFNQCKTNEFISDIYAHNP